MCKYDDYAEGTFDPKNPANQPDSNEGFICISDLLRADEYQDVLDKVLNLRKELQTLRETAKLAGNAYFFNRLNKLIQEI